MESYRSADGVLGFEGVPERRAGDLNLDQKMFCKDFFKVEKSNCQILPPTINESLRHFFGFKIFDFDVL